MKFGPSFHKRRPTCLPDPVQPRRTGRRAVMFGGLAVSIGALAITAPRRAAAHDFTVGSLRIEHPWSRATPGGAKVAGGYMVIHNRGTIPDALVAVTSPVAGTVEIHEMAYVSNVMTMRPLPAGLEVPAGGSVALKPGSYHLMLMDLKQPLKKGESFPATLRFRNAGSISVSFVVEAMGSSGSHH